MMVALVLGCTAALAGTASARTIRISDVRRIADISSPRISPDGRRIVCVLTRPNYGRNRYDSSLLLITISHDRQRILPLPQRDVASPQWSPDGTKIAYVATDESGKDPQQQVFIVTLATGTVRRVTNAPNGVDVFSWKPDGTTIAYTTQDDPPNKAAIDAGHDYFEIGNDPYLTTEEPMPVHVWLIPSSGGRARRLTSGPWSIVSPDIPVPLSWSPDGSQLALNIVPTPHTGDGDRSTIVILNARTGRLRPLTSRRRLELYPVFSPDGHRVAYWYNLGGDLMNEWKFYVSPVSGGDGRDVTSALDRDVNGALWMPDGTSLLVGANDGTRVSLWLQPLHGPPRKLNLGDVNPSNDYWIDFAVGPHGEIAFSGASPRHPVELYYLATPGGPLRRLTDVNAGIAALDLGRNETITWRGPDGFTEDGVLTFPPHYRPGRKYPLIVRVHGGPNAASTTEFWDWVQLAAARGYLVFQPNYRGSDNLGNAYERAIWNDAGDGPGRDVMAGLAAVQRMGIVDSSRIAVCGWSYGGYMTAWLVGHYDVWKADVMGAAETDTIEDYDLSDSNVSDGAYFKGSPWVGDNMQAYIEQSPITYWKNIHTPTLILSNTGDVRVPVTQSYKMYHALKDNHVPVRFIAWPESGHEVNGPVRVEDLYRLWLDWFDRYLR
jgi:dipeptidyl aminopeptidase/acylaminoacyl peptidase